jgi:hypothetical protein
LEKITGSQKGEEKVEKIRNFVIKPSSVFPVSP